MYGAVRWEKRKKDVLDEDVWVRVVPLETLIRRTVGVHSVVVSRAVINGAMRQEFSSRRTKLKEKLHCDQILEFIRRITS